jgi:hypothetical protein
LSEIAAYVSHLDAEGPFCENRHVAWELLLPVGFVLLASLGALCAGLAVIHYLKSRDIDDEPGESVAMVAFALQYFLFCTITTLGSYLLLPTILLFLTFMALLIAIWVGVQSHSSVTFSTPTRHYTHHALPDVLSAWPENISYENESGTNCSG